MASFNKVVLMGHLTADPELKQTQSGLSVTSFDIGVNRRGENAGSNFFHITAWRQTAEFICRNFHKGDAILVCGMLDNREWTDKNGNKRITTEINADEVTFCGKRDNAEPSQQEKPAYQPQQQSSTYMPKTYAEEKPNFEDIADNDDLPF